MKKRLIPGTSIEVTPICIGTMTWGKQNTEAEAHEQLSCGIDLGVNFIDTAEMYPIPPDSTIQGTTERIIGSWLKNRGKRDDLVIASKVGASDIIRTREIRGSRTVYDRQNIREALEGTLLRLGTEYLDLYQIHWPERRTNFFGQRNVDYIDESSWTPFEETLSALGELVQEGKVRAIGISNESPWGVSEYLRLAREKNYPRISTIQNQYSLTNRLFEIGLAEQCLKENVGLLAYSPLSGGVLSGKYLDGARPEGARFTLFTRNSERYNNPHVQSTIKRYVELARVSGIDPAVMALAYCVQKPFMTSVIIGTTSVDQMKHDVSAGDITLSDDIVAAIEAIYTEAPDPQA